MSLLRERLNLFRVKLKQGEKLKCCKVFGYLNRNKPKQMLKRLQDSRVE